MSTPKFQEIKNYTGGFKDRSHWERQAESKWAHKAIGNIEDFLTGVDWDDLGKEYDLSDYLKTGDLSGLQDWKGTATGQLSTLEGGLGTAQSDIKSLQSRLDNWDTTTEVGDVQGLTDIISGLKDKYASTGDVSDLQSQLGNLTGTGAGSISDQIKTATDALGINDYLKTSDFDTRMTNNLDALGEALRGEFGAGIKSLDLEGVRQSIEDQGGDLSKLTTDFAGLSTDMDWLKGLDLGGLDSRIQGDLTDLQNLLETDRGKELSDLETQLGKDRAADLLDLKTKLESGTASDIEAMAGNLRQEFGDDVFDLSTTFEGKLGDVKSALGGDISSLFSKSDTLQSGIDTLTSDLGTTSQQLAALEGSFGDYKTDAATNLANVEAAFSKQLGDQGTDFTKQLGDLQSSTAADILGLSTKTATDIAGAKSEAVADAATAASAGREQLRTDLTSDREAALSKLGSNISGQLEAKDKAWQTQFDEGAAAFNKRLTDISQSNTNYRTLGDSAQGVKIRRSRAYNTGRTRSGTGQLGRSMKISTLNL